MTTDRALILSRLCDALEVALSGTVASEDRGGHHRVVVRQGLAGDVASMLSDLSAEDVRLVAGGLAVEAVQHLASRHGERGVQRRIRQLHRRVEELQLEAALADDGCPS